MPPEERDEVRVFDLNGRRMGQPDGGWPGIVTTVGRKYVTIDYGHRTEKFQFDGRRANDPAGSRYFRTMEQVRLAARRDLAVAALNAHKIRLDPGHNLTLEQIEALAEVSRTFEDG